MSPVQEAFIGCSYLISTESDIANLVVATAFLHQEIKRRIVKGDSTYRAPRRADQAYPADGQPNPLPAEATQ